MRWPVSRCVINGQFSTFPFLTFPGFLEGRLQDSK